MKFLAQVTQYYMAARQIQFPSFDETEFDSKRFSKHMLYVIFSLRKRKENKILRFWTGLICMWYEFLFLDALASLDFKLSVSQWLIFFQLAHLRAFQIFFNWFVESSTAPEQHFSESIQLLYKYCILNSKAKSWVINRCVEEIPEMI